MVVGKRRWRDKRGGSLSAASPAMTTDQDRLTALYLDAFRRFGATCLWSKRPVPPVTPAAARAVAYSLKREGDREAWMLAGLMEKLCATLADEIDAHATDAAPNQGPAAAGRPA